MYKFNVYICFLYTYFICIYINIDRLVDKIWYKIKVSINLLVCM